MFDTDTREQEFMEVVIDCSDVLCALQDHGPMTLADLDAEFSESRRSIGRWLDDLEQNRLIEHVDHAYELTFLGAVAIEHHRDIKATFDTLAEAEELLARLPPGTDIGCAMMKGVDVEIEPALAPEAAWEPVDRRVATTDHVRGFAPRVTRSYIATFYEQIVEQDTAVELVLPQAVLAAIVANFDQEWQAAITADNCWFGATETVPPFGMLILDESEVWIGVYRDSGSALAGTLRNDSAAAVEWALDLYKSYRTEATDVVPLS